MPWISSKQKYECLCVTHLSTNSPTNANDGKTNTVENFHFNSRIISLVHCFEMLFWRSVSSIFDFVISLSTRPFHNSSLILEFCFNIFLFSPVLRRHNPANLSSAACIVVNESQLAAVTIYLDQQFYSIRLSTLCTLKWKSTSGFSHRIIQLFIWEVTLGSLCRILSRLEQRLDFPPIGPTEVKPSA